MANHETAVVILNYNGRDFLRQFLPGILRHSAGARIIVADNNSSDGSAGMLAQEFPEVEVIALASNLGFCGGYNAALRQVKAETYVLLNSDVEVTPGWLEPMLKILSEQKAAMAVQPKVLSWHNRTTFEYAGAGGGLIDALGYPFCRGRLFDAVETDRGQYNDQREIFWATGACLAIRSEAFRRGGGFDEDFFAHMEEIDLCWKLRRAGGEIWYTGASTIFHIGGGTLSKLSPQKTYYNFRNGLTLILKNMRSSELLWKLPLRMLLDWAACANFAVKGSFSNALAVIRAHASFITGFGGALRKRRQDAGIGFSIRRKGVVYPGSIVAARYLRGKKEVGELRF